MEVQFWLETTWQDCRPCALANWPMAFITTFWTADFCATVAGAAFSYLIFKYLSFWNICSIRFFLFFFSLSKLFCFLTITTTKICGIRMEDGQGFIAFWSVPLISLCQITVLEVINKTELHSFEGCWKCNLHIEKGSVMCLSVMRRRSKGEHQEQHRCSCGRQWCWLQHEGNLLPCPWVLGCVVHGLLWDLI